ncbi:MAG: diguanylate cyclase [Rubrivivax sp.]|nr:diguanylate cyclase [Rubrivivax sp.]
MGSTPSPPLPLAGMLRRGHWRVAALALVLATLIVGAVAVQLLRGEVGRNLQGAARNAAFSAEAAVVFEDAQAARELLALLAEQERLATARIVLTDQRVLAEVQRGRGTLARWVDRLAATLFDLQAQAPVTLNQRTRATLHVRGDGQALLGLLGGYALGLAAAMAATALLVVLGTRRLEDRITAPLRALVQFTRSVRETRAFALRALRSDIAEIDALAEDFNALLTEVQAREAEQLAREQRLRSRNEVLRQQAEADALTGLPNRATFTQRLQQAVERAAERGGMLGLMFVDADRFKAINDTYGHAVGDRVLVEIGQRLQRALRESDLVARLGGDEFAVLLEPLSEPADAALVARKIEAQMERPLPLETGPAIVPRVSIGLAFYPGDGADAAALLQRADQLMYDVKRGRATAQSPDSPRLQAVT